MVTAIDITNFDSDKLIRNFFSISDQQEITLGV